MPGCLRTESSPMHGLQIYFIMSSSKLQDADEVFETQRLDSSLQKARAQLSAKGRRQRPSRSRLRDSVSSTEGDDILEKKASDSCGSPLHRLRSPLHGSLQASSPLSGSSPFARTAEFSFDTSTVRRSLDPEDQQPSSPLIRYRPLTNTSSQEALGGTPTSSSPKSCHSSDSSPIYARRERHSEDDSRDTSPPEPASPTIGLDKKTRRKFLDLGVTLRRASSGKGRKEKGGNRLSMGNRELVEGSSRSSVSPFMPFSWFTDSGKGSASSGSTASPTSSPKNETFSRKKSASQESTLSDDSTPPSSSPKTLSTAPAESKCSYPYHTLSQSSDEFLDEPLSAASTWSSQKVGQWLESLSLEQYMAEFAAQDVDGYQLLQLDGTKLKALGVSNSHDRSLLKRKLKELNAAVEKEKKAQEKVEKQKEKQKKKEREQEQRKS
ncbi:sterile alpha motif domain-containing protein 14 isoform X2 [Hemicordylus capensis]|uniref:sterile alpha motif domain-containing protein 14 isoform X2 n=2 Tax=Hemicordylus capensis TaxID=884348 RepID=UPI0023039B93|nr:sterile alpha motif domain-containing protein 14 isoform X2 [Hemicordylus capensis]